MRPVSILAMPHNNRCGVWPGDLDPDGDPWPDPQLTYVTLPIPMPTSVFVTYGPGGFNDALAIDILGPGDERGRVPRADTMTVLAGVMEYNADLAASDRGTEPALPEVVMDAVAGDELEDWDE